MASSKSQGTHRVPYRTGGCLCFITSRIGLFQPLIYIEMTFDLYINGKRFIYKSKTIYIFIVNDLYINRYLLFQKSYFYLKNFLFLPF
ncbi:hypothetical protein CS543_07920 [Porphyromonas gingivalis]|nr:hypothetical protein CS543_07920 [Porphyromonas gingivalis]